MPHHMVVRKPRKPKKKEPFQFWQDLPKEEEILVPKKGRDNESYRASRRNAFITITRVDTEDGEKLVSKTIRKKDPQFYNLAEYGKVYELKHPEFIKRISDRGEVHYVPERREET